MVPDACWRFSSVFYREFNMNQKLQNFHQNVRTFGVPAVMAASMAPALSFAEATGVTSEITAAQTEIIGYVAAWGAAFIAVALAGVGWRVGAKLIKRMAGAA